MWNYAARVWRRWFKPATVFMILGVLALAVFSAFAALTPSFHSVFFAIGRVQANPGQPAVELEQCRIRALGVPATTTVPGACDTLGWVKGNAGPSNSHYAESFSIPYRLIMTDLHPSQTVVSTLGYDIKLGGNHAIDYLTSFDNLNPHSLTFGHSAETVTPTDGIALTGPTTTIAITAPN